MKEKPDQKSNLPVKNETTRLIALSDGLFATVLTLLVLDLRIPEGVSPDNTSIQMFIQWIGPHLFSYLLTFLVAGTYWFAHHRDFELIIHSNRRLLGYNLIFLLFIGLLPFSTAAISPIAFKSNTYPFYWAIYAVNIIFAGIMLNVTWIYAVSHGFVNPNTTKDQIRYITLRRSITPVIFLISIITEFLFRGVYLGPATLLLVPLALTLVDRANAQLDPEIESNRSGWTEFLWRAGSILPWVIVIGISVWAMSN